jgi:hypothetical protein
VATDFRPASKKDVGGGGRVSFTFFAPKTGYAGLRCDLWEGKATHATIINKLAIDINVVRI